MHLDDLLVLELATVLAGPSVGMFLAELGARVIKIEDHRRGGDSTRGWRLPGEPAGAASAYFSSVNWGKASLGLDLARPEGRRVAHDLARRADVVLVNYRPGDAARLGVDADTLCALSPTLVYAAIDAYGPDDARGGYDAVIQAETGFMHLNGTPESGPVKMPVALMDVLAAHQLKEAILLALLERARTGHGGRVAVSLIAAGLSSLVNQAASWLWAGANPRRLGSAHPAIVPYGSAWACAGGDALVLAVGTDDQFARLARVLGAPELARDPRFATNAERVRHREALEPLLAARIAAEPRDALLDRLHAEGVPAGAIHDVAEALAQPAAQPLLLEADGRRGLRTFPTAHARLSPPPALGADTRAVLEGVLGYDAAAIDALVAAGVVPG